MIYITYLKADLNPKFPMNEAATTQLYTDIQTHLVDIYQYEKEAVAALQNIAIN